MWDPAQTIKEIEGGLFEDQGGYKAIHAWPGYLHWLPVRAGPQNTSCARDAYLVITEGRHKIITEGLPKRSPAMGAVSDRLFDKRKMW
jgi:hypothetical protein